MTTIPKPEPLDATAIAAQLSRPRTPDERVLDQLHQGVEVYVTEREDGAWDISLRINGGYFNRREAEKLAEYTAGVLEDAGRLEMHAIPPAQARPAGTPSPEEEPPRMTMQPAETHVPQTLVRLTLVPVEVFGGCDHPGCGDDCGTFGYGLCDAVGPGYSDCNRAEGKIYRIEDLDEQGQDPTLTYEGEQVRVQIWVSAADAEFFNRRHADSPREGQPMRRCGHCAADQEAATL